MVGTLSQYVLESSTNHFGVGVEHGPQLHRILLQIVIWHLEKICIAITMGDSINLVLSRVFRPEPARFGVQARGDSVRVDSTGNSRRLLLV